MEKCAYCGADTILIYNATPICLECDKKQEARIAELRLRPARRSETLTGEADKEVDTGT
jgi:hypothetical protein